MAAPKFPTQRFDQADAALAYVTQLYDAHIAHLQQSLQRFVAGESLKQMRTKGYLDRKSVV